MKNTCKSSINSRSLTKKSREGLKFILEVDLDLSQLGLHPLNSPYNTDKIMSKRLSPEMSSVLVIVDSTNNSISFLGEVFCTGMNDTSTSSYTSCVPRR